MAKQQAEVPQIYDIQIDAFRPVTQKDVDRLVEVGQAYGRLATTFLQTHARLFPKTPLGKVLEKHLTHVGSK